MMRIFSWPLRIGGWFMFITLIQFHFGIFIKCFPNRFFYIFNANFLFRRNYMNVIELNESIRYQAIGNIISVCYKQRSKSNYYLNRRKLAKIMFNSYISNPEFDLWFDHIVVVRHPHRFYSIAKCTADRLVLCRTVRALYLKRRYFECMF